MYYSDGYDEGMRISVDYNNMLCEAVGSHGITLDELKSMGDRMASAAASLETKRDKMRWRELYRTQADVVERILNVSSHIRKDCKDFIVLGIGGSALGPIAVHQALNHLKYNDLPAEKRNGPRLFVEDNIDPERMMALLDVIDTDNAVFNVITKSGSTSETMAQLLIITRLLLDRYGEENLKDHLIATTDKEKGNLIGIAKKYDLITFCVPDGVGGRFSELCPVGLLSAAVCGADIRAMLAGAEYMDRICTSSEPIKNPALMSAALEVIAMEEHGANIGVLMPYADSLKYFADWYAQLWAESIGKKKQMGDEIIRVGQTPVKSLGVTDQHSQVQLYTDGPYDKTVTFIGVEKYRCNVDIPHVFDDIPGVAFLSGHSLNELIIAERLATEHALTVSGHMNKTILLPEVNEFTIGQLIMLLELQTAYAGELLGVDAFDQPGVEEGKNATYALLGKPGYDSKLQELNCAAKKRSEYII